MTAWDWALAAWRRPGVEAAALELQNGHGQCVGYLLWGLWTAAEGRALDAADLARAAALTRDWEAGLLSPLRAMRGRLKAPVDLIGDGRREEVGARVAATLLDAERALIDALESLAGPPGPPAPTPASRLGALVEAWGPPAPPAQSLARLIDAI